MVDLFAGQDLVLLARYQGSGPAHLRFTGRTASGPVDWASDVTFPERERANPFVARLWATQRIGYLEAARHKSGPSTEIDAELRSLGERFGIPTELTSYLVREPAVAVTPPAAWDGRVGMVAPSGGVAGAPAPTSENSLQGNKKDALQYERQVVTGVATSAAAFDQAKVAAAQRAATTLSAADSTATLAAGARAVAVQHAGDRTFVQRDSTWTDTRYHLGMRLVRVQAFSPAYFALVTAVPDLRSAFAIGEHVIVAGRQVAVEVTPSGVGQLSDSDVAAVRAAW
jgi:hypothetical protein